MSIKVLEVNVDDYLYGGVYVLVTELIRTLPPDIKADIAALEPFVEASHVESLKENNCNVHYVGFGGNKLKKQFRIYQNVKALIEKEGYDVVHLHSDVAHKILVSAKAAEKCGVKKIIFHSHASNAEGSHRKLRGFFHRICAKRMMKIPAVHLATSKEAGEWMYPGSEDFTVLRNGVDYKKYAYVPEVRQQIRREWNLEDKLVIGYVGRIVEAKNPFFLIDLMTRMKELAPDAVLLCIGEGHLREELQRRVRECGLEDHFLFRGSTDRIQDCYQAMDAVVLPSDFEGFGLVAVEAQISGTPVVASTNVPEMTRISDRITYLPADLQHVDDWCRAILPNRDREKAEQDQRLDDRYDLHHMTDYLIGLYRGTEDAENGRERKE